MRSRLGANARDQNLPDRGSITAVAPLIGTTIALFVLVVQVSLWFYGQTVLTAAAQHGLDAARVGGHESDGAAGAAGRRMAEQFLAQSHGVGDHETDVEVAPDEVTVRIDAEPLDVLSVVPLPAVTVEMTAARERVVE